MQHQRNSCTYDPNIDAPSIAIDKKVDWQRTKQYDLLPKESYTETIELTEKVPLHNFRFIKYQFSQKDKYTISASFRFPYHNTGNRELLVTSNQLSLIVE
jgi:hypothetical protein